MLELSIGAELELAITKKGFIARPVCKGKRKRYSLKEVLQGTTPSNLKALKKNTAWARKGKAKGREIT